MFCQLDHAAPPKKPPRPGAPSHLGSLASLNSPVDSYNEGVKVHCGGALGVGLTSKEMLTC